MATIGIHLVWTTYGTWLPGDDRGHWSALYDMYGHILQSGGKLNQEDLGTNKLCKERMKGAACVLRPREIQVVANTLGEIAAEHKIDIYAAAIEETHVHLLVGPLNEHVGITVGRFKGKTSSDLLQLPENAGRERTWTAKYWKVFLFDEIALAQVRQYIENHNIRRGLPAAPYPWIRTI